MQVHWNNVFDKMQERVLEWKLQVKNSKTIPGGFMFLEFLLDELLSSLRAFQRVINTLVFEQQIQQAREIEKHSSSMERRRNGLQLNPGEQLKQQAKEDIEKTPMDKAREAFQMQNARIQGSARPKYNIDDDSIKTKFEPEIIDTKNKIVYYIFRTSKDQQEFIETSPRYPIVARSEYTVSMMSIVDGIVDVI